MNEMTTYTMVKSMAASSIFACAPEALIKKHEAAIYEGSTIDDWTSAVMLLREWANYTRELENDLKNALGEYQNSQSSQGDRNA